MAASINALPTVGDQRRRPAAPTPRAAPGLAVLDTGGDCPPWLLDALARRGLEPSVERPVHRLLRECDLPEDVEEHEKVPVGTEHDALQEELAYVIRSRYRNRPDVLVAGDLFVYFDGPGTSLATADRLAPDLMVAFGVPDRRRSNYVVWREGKAPDFVLEIFSPSTRTKDIAEKPALYRRMGVREYSSSTPTAAPSRGSPGGASAPAKRGRCRWFRWLAACAASTAKRWACTCATSSRGRWRAPGTRAAGCAGTTRPPAPSWRRWPSRPVAPKPPNGNETPRPVVRKPPSGGRRKKRRRGGCWRRRSRHWKPGCGSRAGPAGETQQAGLSSPSLGSRVGIPAPRARQPRGSRERTRRSSCRPLKPRFVSSLRAGLWSYHCCPINLA